MSGRALKNDFLALNARLTRDVVERIGRAGRHSAVIAEAPPGAGKSTLTASVAEALLGEDRALRLAIVTQTNEQADDLVRSLASRRRVVPVTRMVGGSANSEVMGQLAANGAIRISANADDADALASHIVVSTARKWQFERARMQKAGAACRYSIALVDEAYQMRSDILLGIAGLYETLFCVGDPGQLDPFAVVDDSVWKGLRYSPSRAALATLRAFHPDLKPIQLPISWRLPPSAAGIVSSAFYPFSGFEAGTVADQRQLILGKSGHARPKAAVDVNAVLDRAAETGWCYVELDEKVTPRTDREIASVISEIVKATLKRGGTVVDELQPRGVPLSAGRVAVITAHNDQVQAVRFGLSQAGVDPDAVVVSTANKIQGREYDLVLVWHPLAGRRDATAFHLEAGRMCVMLSRHRHACIVVNRAGATRLLEEFPDSDPMFLDEPEKFPDGWEANHRVLQHLESCKLLVS
jgi:hypothetical protein